MKNDKTPINPRLRGLIWLAAVAAVGVALVFLYPDSYQQDGGHHYLFARWAWVHHTNFVSVWGRPLFTFLYAFPATIGYTAARLFTVALTVITAWQTWRLAEDLKFERAELAIPFLFLQPSYLLLCADVMTEPLFALILIVALRLHLRGRMVLGMLVASLMILARPEGLFLGVLWGIWVLLDRRGGRAWWRRLPSTLLLASGMVIWWLAAWLISGDPLWIKHDWPPDWQLGGATYGRGPVWWYAKSLPVVVGLFLLLPFAAGLVRLFKQRRFGTGVSAFLWLFTLHSLMYTRGAFGSAGYPRYFVCVAPAMALITLAGWNEIAERLLPLSRLAVNAALIVVLVLSGWLGLFYVDGWGYSRDAWAVTEMYQWFRAHPRPVTRLIWSQAYMNILFDRDSWEKPVFSNDTAHNVQLLRESPPGTLVFWDGETGPAWYGLRPADFETAGYTHLRSQSYRLEGLFFQRAWQGHGGGRTEEMHLFYRER